MGVNRDAGFLNNIETALVGGSSIYFITPYQLTTNPTVTNGSTSTLTCTGVGGIPSGATGVLLGYSVTSGTAGAYAQIGPHGGTMGSYFSAGNIQVANSYASGMATVPLDATGKMDVKANGANVVLQTWYLFGYLL